MHSWRDLWKDESGTLLSSEYLILGTLLTIGLLVGISATQNSLVTELEDYAAAIMGIGSGGLAGTSTVTFDGAEAGTFSSP